MKTKILTSVALASLMSLSFIACSSEPKSVEELKKLSDDELEKMQKNCIAKNGEDSMECENISEALFQKGLSSREYRSIFGDNNKTKK